MANEVTTTWKVLGMTRVVSDGFVVTVDWSCTAASGVFPDVKSAFAAGQEHYENNPDEPGFVPYDQLTEQIVLGWVFETLGDQKAKIEADLTAKVEAQLHPVTAEGLPWQTAPAA